MTDAARRSPERARIVLEEAIEWRNEGTIGDDFHAWLVSRYGEAAAAAEGSTPSAVRERAGLATGALYAVGGLFLGVATLAYAQFMDWNEGGLFFPIVAFLALGAGVALELGARNRGLAEAALFAALVPAAAASFPENPGPLALLATLAVPLAVVVLRRGEMPSVGGAAVAFSIGTIGVVGDLAANEATAYFLLSAAFAGVLYALPKGVWQGPALAVQLVALAAALGVILTSEYNAELGGSLELPLGLFLGGVLAFAVWSRLRAVVAVAIAGLVVDAVVFAFSVGGPGGAVVTLLALGAGLISQAELLRRFFATARSGASDGPP